MLDFLFTVGHLNRSMIKALTRKGPQVKSPYNWVPGHEHYFIDYEKVIAGMPVWGKLTLLIVGIFVIAALVLVFTNRFTSFDAPKRPLAKENK